MLALLAVVLMVLPIGTAAALPSPSGTGSATSGSSAGLLPGGTVLLPGPYVVTFNETGLPAGTQWNVSVNGSLNTSTTAEVTFSTVNGSYSFQIGTVSGYEVNNSSGPVNVVGSNVTVYVHFTEVYPVTFQETGLPPGSTWWVYVGSTASMSTSSTLLVYEPNGQYSYSVKGPANYSAPGGSFHVQSGPLTVSVPFSVVTYQVNFKGSGLPSSTWWYVKFPGLPGQSYGTSGSQISVALPNGTFSYDVTTSSVYQPVPSSGNVTVQGVPQTVSIVFEYLWAVNFTETGLPAGHSWNVTVNGTTHQSTSSTIGFDETNGTNYPFEIGFESGYSAQPAVGTFNVTGPQSKPISIGWTRVIYHLTFTESGLPSGTSWTVSLGPYGASSSTFSSISLPVPNGTFTYSVLNLSGYSPQPSTGTVTVHGSNPSTIYIVFYPTYDVTFLESGLTTGTNWSVTLGGNSAFGTGTSLVIPELSGTYPFRIGEIAGFVASPVTGTVGVNGAAPSPISIVWTAVRYNVTFVETGLPLSSGYAWSVTFGPTLTAQTKSSSTNWVNFTVPNGTYPFAVGAVNGYAPSPAQGSVPVSGANVTLTIQFRPEPTYGVFFNETGLASGTNWNVTLAQVEYNSTTPTIRFVEVNNSYSFQIAPVAGYSANRSSGSVTVNGANVTVWIGFTAIPYSVSFVESGLPRGANWSVTVSGATRSSTTNAVVFSLPNGSYAFSVAGQDGFVAEPSSGTVVVNGSAVTQSINWTKFAYSLVFGESGLPAGTNWSITLSGVTQTTNLTEIVFSEANNSYHYSLGKVAGYWAPSQNRSGTVTINGSSQTLSFQFQPFVYSVTFREYGLPTNATWALSIDGGSFSTTNSSLVVSLPNGSYPYTVAPQIISGTTWAPTFTSGVVNVTGGRNSTTLHFAAQPPGQSPLFTFTAFDEELLALTLVIVLVLALLGFVVRPLNRRHRTGPNPLLPPPDESGAAVASAPSAPPAGAMGLDLNAPAPEIAPTTQNSTTLLRLAVVLGRLIAEKKGPQVDRWNLELRRAIDLIESYRLTEAMRVLGRLRTEVTAPPPTPRPSSGSPPRRTNPQRTRWATPAAGSQSGSSRSSSSSSSETSERASTNADAPLSGVGASLGAWPARPNRAPPRQE